MILFALVATLVLAAIGLSTYLLSAAARTGQLVPKPEGLAVGAVTNFFDTLGIGSFAPTIAWFRFRHLVEDRLIPLLCWSATPFHPSFRALSSSSCLA